MRILQVTPRLFGGPKLGGGERFAYELTQALAARTDTTVEWFVVDWPQGPRPRGQAIGWAKGLARFAAAVRAADLVHVHQINSPAFDVAILLSGFARRPVVLTDHGGGWRTPGRALGRYRLATVRAVCAVSEWSLVDVGLDDPQRGWVIYGGGDHVLRVDASERSWPAVDFLFVGRIVPHKGLHDFIAALPEENSLRIAGAANEAWYLEELRELAIGKNVEFVHRPEDHELPALYRSARFTVLPSTYRAYGRVIRRPELLGLVLLESMACGTPCIGSAIAAMPEVLTRAGMPVLPVGSVSAIRRALKQLPGPDSPEYDAMRRSAQSAAAAFTWSATADRCVDAYRAVLSGHQETDRRS